MPPHANRLAVRIVLLAIFAWPIAHFLVVHRLGSDPWSFGGWAMYATPRQHIDLQLTIDGKQVRPSGRCVAQEASFLMRRRALGTIERPDEVLRCIRHMSRSMSRVQGVVRTWVLDDATQRLRVSQYRYQLD